MTPRGYDANLAGFDFDHAELGAEAQIALLCHDQEFAIGVEEMLALHGFCDEQHVRSHAGLRLGIAGGGHGVKAAHKRELLFRDCRGAPAILAERKSDFVMLRRGADQAVIDLLEATGVAHGRADTVEPCALVGVVWCGEGRARKLLGVEAVIDLLRRIAADGKRARQSFGLERVAEAGHIFCCHHLSSAPRRCGACAAPTFEGL